MADGFAGDPYHEGASQPMAHLKGGMEQPNTQMPLESEPQNNPRSAAVDNVAQTWNTTSLASAPSPSTSNDSRRPN